MIRVRAYVALVGLSALVGCSEQRLVIDRVSSPSVDVVVRYPDHMVHGAMDSLSVDIRNVSARVLENVVLLLDSAYAPEWPGPLDSHAWGGGYAIRLESIAPEESRTISARVPALRDDGIQWGRVAVAVGSDTVSIRLRTVIDAANR
jgi:hypothetical protein